ncbi:MAG: hypothetical protein JSU70_12140 [Phycisphaerales bacterium]|nr:MAG: hypothetical protein JSU70_12140 [Phycisphaerales bacterium]
MRGFSQLRMLNGTAGNHLDTGWTLAPEMGEEKEVKEEAASAAPSANPSPKSTSDAAHKWAIQDLNL